MISFPNAKINLGLNVAGRRSDGYHDIETIMVPVNFCDILEVIHSTGEVEFSQTGREIPSGPEENLCMKAYSVFGKKPGKKRARMHLHKIIPWGTGLGGGSSDAAHTLLLLNEVMQAGLSMPELLSMAAGLGSDCPFFMLNKPAIATGRGEILEEVSIDIYDKEIFIVLPGVHISTKWAYARILPSRLAISPVEVIKEDIAHWKEILLNDFEEPVFNEYPQLKAHRDMLYNNGAIYASMSGSGSALFGIFDHIPKGIEEVFKGVKTLRTSILS
jgi:4-diphosphocytidyl-2-C-methyl-D-erythritol kinase